MTTQQLIDEARERAEFYRRKGMSTYEMDRAIDLLTRLADALSATQGVVAWQVRHHGDNGYVSNWNWCYDNTNRPEKSGRFRCEYRPLCVAPQPAAGGDGGASPPPQLQQRAEPQQAGEACASCGFTGKKVVLPSKKWSGPTPKESDLGPIEAAFLAHARRTWGTTTDMEEVEDSYFHFSAGYEVAAQQRAGQQDDARDAFDSEVILSGADLDRDACVLSGDGSEPIVDGWPVLLRCDPGLRDKVLSLVKSLEERITVLTATLMQIPKEQRSEATLAALAAKTKGGVDRG